MNDCIIHFVAYLYMYTKRARETGRDGGREGERGRERESFVGNFGNVILDHPPLIDMYMYMLVYKCIYVQTNEVFSEVGREITGINPTHVWLSCNKSRCISWSLTSFVFSGFSLVLQPQSIWSHCLVFSPVQMHQHSCTDVVRSQGRWPFRGEVVERGHFQCVCAKWCG